MPKYNVHLWYKVRVDAVVEGDDEELAMDGAYEVARDILGGFLGDGNDSAWVEDISLENIELGEIVE